MSGLLRRAKEYLQTHPHLRLVRDDDSDFDSFTGTPEERAQIEREIGEAVAIQRLQSDAASHDVHALRSGTGMPILVNAVAIVLIAAGAYLLFRLFDTQEQLIVTPTAVVASAEGRLLAVLQEQSAAELSVKDAEIEAVRSRLASLEAEQEALLSESQARLVTLEQRLREEFDLELEAERMRLSELQLSDDEVEARLAEFRASREAEIEAEIAAVRVAAEREIEAQRAQIDSMVAQIRDELGVAEADRARLLREMAARENDLVAELAVRDAQILEQQSEARRTLAALEEQQRNEQVVRDQLVGHYAVLRDALTTDDFDRARVELARLNDFLNHGPIAQSASLERQRSIEVFLAGVLQDQIDTLTAPEEVAVVPTEPDPALVAQIEDLEAALATQIDATSNRDAVIESLEQRIGELGAGRAAIERELVATTELVERISADREALETDLAAMRVELGEAERVRDQNDRDLAALAQRLEDQRRLVAAIDEHRAQFVGVAAGQAVPTAIELLETKLTILRIVGSDALRADHPDLLDTLNAYMDDLIVHQRTEAAEATLREVNVLLEQIASATTDSISDLSDRFPLLASQGAGRAAERFLLTLRRVTSPYD